MNSVGSKTVHFSRDLGMAIGGIERVIGPMPDSPWQSACQFFSSPITQRRYHAHTGHDYRRFRAVFIAVSLV